MRDAAVPFHTPTSSLFLPARGEGRERWFGRGLRGFRLVILSVSDPPLPTQSARASCGRGSFPFTLTAPPLSPTLPASRPPGYFARITPFHQDSARPHAPLKSLATPPKPTPSLSPPGPLSPPRGLHHSPQHTALHSWVPGLSHYWTMKTRTTPSPL